ncbi:cytochrome P450, putative [Ricinus communis]|uniref:Cytochrome P450, putative n=1 Tax=Ricinus communis TaxID=3988 RepID=B9REA4_RICCO|nr:cytochrome P450, putative [Ricinus communis]
MGSQKPELVKEILNDSEKWFKMRKLTNFAFYADSLEVNFAEYDSGTLLVMLERWKDHTGSEIEVDEEFKLLASEVISRTAFGSSYIEGNI